MRTLVGVGVGLVLASSGCSSTSSHQPDGAADGAGDSASVTDARKVATLCPGPGDAAPSCASPYADPDAGLSFCPLSTAIAIACAKCFLFEGQASCGPQGLFEGATYTYLTEGDLAISVWAFVYDKSGTLVANLEWPFNQYRWTCSAGPTDVSPEEASVATSPEGGGALLRRCAALAADASSDGRD